jgi:hypothetical protein
VNFKELDWLRTETGRLTAQACQTHEAALRTREQQFFGGKHTLDTDRLHLHVRDIFVMSDLADGDGQSGTVRLEAATVAAAAKPCDEMVNRGEGEEQPVAALRNCSLSLLQHQLEHLGTPQLNRSYRLLF